MGLVTIQPVAIWQTTSLDCAVAEEFFGWKWMAFIGRPTRSHPGYPQEMIVRQFFSPETLRDKQWKEYFSRKEGREATGDEPLCYRYCSSAGPERVPHFSGHRDAVAMLESKLARNKKRWEKYRRQLWVQIGGEGEVIHEARLARADCESRCIAALAVVGSGHVAPAPRLADASRET